MSGGQGSPPPDHRPRISHWPRTMANGSCGSSACGRGSTGRPPLPPLRSRSQRDVPIAFGSIPRLAEVNMRRSAAPSQRLGNSAKKPRFIPPGKNNTICLKKENEQLVPEIKLTEVEEKQQNGSKHIRALSRICGININSTQAVESLEEISSMEKCNGENECEAAGMKKVNRPKADFFSLSRSIPSPTIFYSLNVLKLCTFKESMYDYLRYGCIRCKELLVLRDRVRALETRVAELKELRETESVCGKHTKPIGAGFVKGFTLKKKGVGLPFKVDPYGGNSETTIRLGTARPGTVFIGAERSSIHGRRGIAEGLWAQRFAAPLLPSAEVGGNCPAPVPFPSTTGTVPKQGRTGSPPSRPTPLESASGAHRREEHLAPRALELAPLTSAPQRRPLSLVPLDSLSHTVEEVGLPSTPDTFEGPHCYDGTAVPGPPRQASSTTEGSTVMGKAGDVVSTCISKALLTGTDKEAPL
ncbi:DNA repair and recombination protein RAD54B [Chelonia mydas]|uniref:DNA repair and recombination protein RAD54B n=1 Tax=Chelonia mydas TaxID=8469 RepID=M7B857_CHEMY|nr:DNA repair and recombination protein RAD54B [Chelonia mydas]